MINGWTGRSGKCKNGNSIGTVWPPMDECVLRVEYVLLSVSKTNRRYREYNCMLDVTCFRGTEMIAYITSVTTIILVVNIMSKTLVFGLYISYLYRGKIAEFSLTEFRNEVIKLS